MELEKVSEGRFSENPPVSSPVGMLAVGAATASLFSIFISGLLASLAFVFWVRDCFRDRCIYLWLPGLAWAFAGFIGWSCVAILFSEEPLESLLYLKKFIKFFYLFLLAAYLRPNLIAPFLTTSLLVMTGSALFGILEYAGLKDVTLLNRIDGFMSHWMTFSGQLMIVTVGVAAWIAGSGEVEEPRRHLLGQAVVVSILSATLILTQTRSALAGTMVGLLTALVFTARWRWLTASAVLLVAVGVSLPGSFQQRLLSALDRDDTTTRGRIELLRTGWSMVLAHPWVGVGPRLLPKAAARFRTDDEFPDWQYQHLHNNPLQIAAELGLGALFFWLIFWLMLLYRLARIRLTAQDPLLRRLALIALSVTVSFHVAGLFEYNFGDSEVVILLLSAVALPFAAARPNTLYRKAGPGYG